MLLVQASAEAIQKIAHVEICFQHQKDEGEFAISAIICI